MRGKKVVFNLLTPLKDKAVSDGLSTFIAQDILLASAKKETHCEPAEPCRAALLNTVQVST